MNTNYDVIIIGSGLGALSTASVLSQLKNKRVLILEKHWKIGGYTHTFKRKGPNGQYEWDVGLHYVGRMREGKFPRILFDFVTRGGVKWQKMPPVYDCFNYPGLKFNAHEGFHRFKSDLKETFPDESVNLDEYFSDLLNASKWYGKFNILFFFPNWISKWFQFILKKDEAQFLQTTKEYLDIRFEDYKLKAVLTSQFGDYGLPPSKSPFIMHALLTQHYFGGGYYPKGGSKVISDSIIPIIKKSGGDLLVNHEVKNIIIRNDKAVGVKAISRIKGEKEVEVEFRAPVIISNIGAFNTYTKLIPSRYCQSFRKEIENFPSGTSVITLYLGLKEDPATLGFKGENHWIYKSFDHEENFGSRNDIINGKVSGAYVSFPSMKTDHLEGHTIEIISFADCEPFYQWKDESWNKRGEDYEKLKTKIADAMLDFVESYYPGLRKIIDFQEISTPLSNEFFTSHHNGTIYGIPAVPERFKAKWINHRTPIKNLLMVGADTTTGPGIFPALVSGILAASIVLGIRYNPYRIFKIAKRYQDVLSNG
ncbi:MAG: NAD(P)/FAD-dependent oxidoreductase [Candidatus Marinimicrobia bacterium]|jgi:phytoene dehydrogenase-like protein|nr:NAD(P)/FAD-dependent oxidoreductase [Candidatus Neomarinimicrobiota bacterium]MBT3634493.1 NAD(P)/FAD-dependent oxidoreductase [Candidatus Neomarinimicrobiota bacterium]MBT3683390.1 NAD(P)/FAD-dependent oxidoreductase [Candidatus Neomarinimicrobiota bacterium]MBT3760278.1 NAD(P)/FAD-dependent oxidoreductase [Candidatus Neomarinimicrobiota bacterium]MBT3896373.1 NAD(P)/FAD-dependent oxidoreductase [Candidatus Neomarinimicrobiota bacterium]